MSEQRSQIVPALLAFLISDLGIIERFTNKITLVGIFTRVLRPSFPAMLNHAIYARFTDAEGTYVFRVELVGLDRQLLIFEHDFAPQTVTDRLEQYEFTATAEMVLPRPGRYEYLLYADGAVLEQTVFDALFAP